MILLDFANVEPSELGEDPRKWTDEIFFGAFLGNQIFKIGDVDFSADYPILGFARELKAICFRLKQGATKEVYVDPEHEYPTLIQFQREYHLVLVSNLQISDGTVVSSASVEIDELAEAASKNLDKVISYCSGLNPEVERSQLIRNWLSDFSLPGYQGTLGLE
jgi:hypothetical protein